MQAPPSTHFVSLAQSILSRGAGFRMVWPEFLLVAGIGGLFFICAIMRFRSVASLTFEPDHVYVIPPANYLSFKAGALHLSRPEAGQSVGLPFDVLLRSLAESCGANTIGIVLSGTGADGSLGFKAVKDAGGSVIAQDPEDAYMGTGPATR
jgi:hypothetical protein